MTDENFYWSYTEEPHATRRKLIIKKYPQIKEYFGIDPSFKFVVVSMVIFQFIMAYSIRNADWLLVILQSYFVSGTLNHSLTLAVHECSHNLGYGHKFPLMNRILGFIANLPMGIPMSISFRKYHSDHHRKLGEHKLDTDVPTEFEAKVFVGKLGKLFWLILQPIFYAFRPFLIYKKAVTDFEIINFVLEIAVDVAVLYFCGIKSSFYLIGGFLMSLGLHPLAAHFISDHEVYQPGQETYSYYGVLNMVTFNVGYHIEHHDFPYVAGKNLPKIRKIAPEFYSHYTVHKSWIKLMFNFICDKNITLRNRIKRNLSTPEDFHFYTISSYSSCYCHDFFSWLANLITLQLTKVWNLQKENLKVSNKLN